MNSTSFSRFFQSYRGGEGKAFLCKNPFTFQFCRLKGGAASSGNYWSEESQLKTMGCHSLICVTALCIEEILLPIRNAFFASYMCPFWLYDTSTRITLALFTY